MEVDKLMQQVCLDLNIKFDPIELQDWGIIHSDAKRLNDFMAYYNNSNLDEMQQFYVFELIVASYNDAILEAIINASQENIFSAILKHSTSNKKLDIIKNYWRRISNNEEFPVGKLL